jgi:pantetheine-phosphate adenylyltransferase
MKKCVFAGTFDPPTLGHKALIEDALKMFDEVVIAIMVNPEKTPYFTEGEREEMLRLYFPKENRIRTVVWSGLIVDLLKKENTPFYVRGIRNTVDFEYENANLYASRKLDPSVIAVYIPCRQELLHVSSSVVKNSLKFSTPIDEYVDEKVKAYILARSKRSEKEN